MATERMTPAEAVAFINKRRRFAEKNGLHRIKKLLALLGDPHKNLRFVHVAGTNGKGSVCSFLSAALQRSGYRTGLFISPYVVDFRERMQVNGEMIPPQELVDCVEEVRPLVEQMEENGEPPMIFEIVTAVAMLWFARSGCDLVVLEVGLGGRFDATNVIEAPLVSVITSIGLDHMEYLGDTVGQIAFEKAGILKPGCPAVTADRQLPEALAVLREQAAARGCPLTVPDTAAAELLCHTAAGLHYRYRGFTLQLQMAGEHQLLNSTAALEALLLLREQGINVPDEAITEGFASVRFAARLEVVSQTPLCVIDGAHNRPGAEALLAALPLFDPRRLIAVLGMMADKECADVVAMLAARFDRVITTTVTYPRAASAAALAELAAPHCSSVVAVELPRDAVAQALREAGEDGAVVICGSLYLASEVRPIFFS